MEEDRTGKEEHSTPGQTNGWLLGLLIVLLAATGISVGYAFSQRRATSQLLGANQLLTEKNQQLNSSMDQMGSMVNQMRGQMDALNAKIADMSKPPAPQTTGKRASRHAQVDPRWQQVQAQISEQQKQMQAMQDVIAQNQTGMQNQLGSTRDELNGSIAKTHDELVSLEKRGDRNYHEFDLSKSKNFERVGPVLLSLRKVDQKHGHFNMTILVDDKELTKKDVNLYEPVWIYRNDDPGPTQVVVNQVDKNHVHGYVSEPKFTKAQLAVPETPESAAPASDQAPALNPPVEQPANPQAPSPMKSPNPPQSPQ